MSFISSRVLNFVDADNSSSRKTLILIQLSNYRTKETPLGYLAQTSKIRFQCDLQGCTLPQGVD